MAALQQEETDCSKIILSMMQPNHHPSHIRTRSQHLKRKHAPRHSGWTGIAKEYCICYRLKYCRYEVFSRIGTWKVYSTITKEWHCLFFSTTTRHIHPCPEPAACCKYNRSQSKHYNFDTSRVWSGAMRTDEVRTMQTTSEMEETKSGGGFPVSVNITIRMQEDLMEEVSWRNCEARPNDASSSTNKSLTRP